MMSNLFVEFAFMVGIDLLFLSVLILVMLPLGIVNVVAIAVLYELRQQSDPTFRSFGWTLTVLAASWAVFVISWTITGLLNPPLSDNRPVRISAEP